MPEEAPQFSSQPLGEERPKRRATRRRVVSRSRPRPAASKLNDEMESQLSSIYRDDKGRLPDMKKIKVQNHHSVLKTFFGIIILGGFLAAAAWAGFFLLPAANKMSETQVKLTIDGPKNVELGSANTYKITFENTQNVKLKNATLTVYYPEGFAFTESSLPAKNSGHTEWDLGIIGANKKGELTITGQSYGTLNKESSWRVFLNYQPENFNSMLQKITTLATKINKSPLTLTVSGPDKVTAGNEVEYSFNLKMEKDFDAKQLELTPIWPANFHLTDAVPTMKKNGWIITSSTPEMIFKAKGKFSNTDTPTNEVKVILYLPQPNQEQKFEVAASSINTEVIKNALNFNLAINGQLNNFSAQPGEILNITINAKNASPETINKATVKLILEAPSYQRQSILNWTELDDKNEGIIKGEQVSEKVRRGQITWNEKLIPSLAELKFGDEVSIDLQMPIKNSEKFNLDAVEEYKISVSAEITFLDASGQTKTIASNPIIITLNSDLSFESRHQVATRAETNELHEVTWVLNNTFHPLKNISLTADIYGDAAWQDPTNIPAGEVKFDPKNKQITWTVPEMPLTLDVLALPMKIVLNKKDPTQQTLMSKTKIQAEDTVTGETIELTGEEIPLIK